MEVGRSSAVSHVQRGSTHTCLKVDKFPAAMLADAVPHGLQAWLDGWGAKLRSEVEAAVTEATCHVLGEQPNAQSPARPPVLLVGTDCSGLEAPIHALAALKIKHDHSWGSEIAQAPKQMILLNSKPQQLFDSVLDGVMQTAPYVHMYISGFSCKPFSMLHHRTKLLEEQEAQVFWAVRDRLHRVRPACFVLENVLGIRRVLREVVEALEGHGLYHVSICEMDPAHLQEPCRRPRLYLLGTRTDVALGNRESLQKVVQRTWHRVRQAYARGPIHTLQQRLLPPSHPAVQQNQHDRQERWREAWQCPFTLSFKFRCCLRSCVP